MSTLLPQLYVAAVAVAGLAIGGYLHHRLKQNDQITVKAPSPFRNRARQDQWLAYEIGAHA